MNKLKKIVSALMIGFLVVQFVPISVAHADVESGQNEVSSESSASSTTDSNLVIDINPIILLNDEVGSGEATSSFGEISSEATSSDATSTESADVSSTVSTSTGTSTATSTVATSTPAIVEIPFSTSPSPFSFAPASLSIQSVMVADTEPPVIELIGSSTVNLKVGDDYIELGASSTDAVSGTSTPVITGTVSTSTPGQYILTYTATDASDNVASTTRTVNVRALNDDASLSDLSVVGYELTPVFASTTLDYTVILPTTATSVPEVLATTTDMFATSSIMSTSDISTSTPASSTATTTIVVTAEDATTTIMYRIIYSFSDTSSSSTGTSTATSTATTTPPVAPTPQTPESSGGVAPLTGRSGNGSGHSGGSQSNSNGNSNLIITMVPTQAIIENSYSKPASNPNGIGGDTDYGNNKSGTYYQDSYQSGNAGANSNVNISQEATTSENMNMASDTSASMDGSQTAAVANAFNGRMVAIAWIIGILLLIALIVFGIRYNQNRNQ